jgi:hypothetical protein
MTFGTVYVCTMLCNSEQVTITQEQVIMTFAPLTISNIVPTYSCFPTYFYEDPMAMGIIQLTFQQ